MSVLSVGTAAWVLYDRASRIKTIGSWISYLVPQTDPRLRELLECLARRVDAIVQPLNFCLLWAQDKGTNLTDVIFQARDVLYRVEKYIQDCAMKQKANEKWLFEQGDMLEKLTNYLKELDFAIQSVNLAMSLIQATKASSPIHTNTFSPSALLRASERIREMHDTGGDVTLSFGSFYRLAGNVVPPSSSTSVTPDNKLRASPSTEALLASGHAHGPHQLLSALSSRSGPRQSPVPPPGNYTVTTADDSWEKIDEGKRPQSDDSWELIYPNSVMKIVRNAQRWMYELHVEDVEPASVNRDVRRRADRKMHFELSSSVAFQASSSQALGLNDMNNPDFLSGVVDVSFTWIEKLGGQVQARYAFVLTNVYSQMASSGGLRPLDVAYTTKLCIYENYTRRNAEKVRTPTPIAHISASDEELQFLLGDVHTDTLYRSQSADPSAPSAHSNPLQQPVPSRLSSGDSTRSTSGTLHAQTTVPAAATPSIFFQSPSAGAQASLAPTAEQLADAFPASTRSSPSPSLFHAEPSAAFHTMATAAQSSSMGSAAPPSPGFARSHSPGYRPGLPRPNSAANLTDISPRVLGTGPSVSLLTSAIQPRAQQPSSHTRHSSRPDPSGRSPALSSTPVSSASRPSSSTNLDAPASSSAPVPSAAPDFLAMVFDGQAQSPQQPAAQPQQPSASAISPPALFSPAESVTPPAIAPSSNGHAPDGELEDAHEMAAPRALGDSGGDWEFTNS